MAKQPGRARAHASGKARHCPGYSLRCSFSMACGVAAGRDGGRSSCRARIRPECRADRPHEVVGILRRAQRAAGAETFVERPDAGGDVAVHRHVAAKHEAARMDMRELAARGSAALDRERQIPWVAELDAAAAMTLSRRRIVPLQVAADSRRRPRNHRRRRPARGRAPAPARHCARPPVRAGLADGGERNVRRPAICHAFRRAVHRAIVDHHQFGAKAGCPGTRPGPT